MKIFIAILFTAASLSMNSQVSARAKLDIEWDKPEKFSDVRPTNQTRKHFRESTFEEIESYWMELAAGLDDSHKLFVKVTNLDLAGNVWPATHTGLGLNNSDVRVVKSHDIPRINFSYQLLDETGAVVKQAEVKLKDMMFFDRSSRSFKNESLRYEKSMLKRWFDDEFATELADQSTLAATDKPQK